VPETRNHLIESVFATVRHRTVQTKGALSQDTARFMVLMLVMAAAKTWHRLKGGGTSCPKSSRVSHSATVSRSSTRQHRTPPDHGVTHFPAYPLRAHL